MSIKKIYFKLSVGLIIFSINYLYCFIGSGSPERLKRRLEKNIEKFEEVAESFAKQKGIRYLHLDRNDKYMIDGVVFKIFHRERGQRKGIESKEIKIKVLEKGDIIFDPPKIKSLSNTFDINASDFSQWIDFLTNNNLHELKISRGIVFFVFSYGFMSEETGLFYVPIANKDSLRYYYPTWPGDISNVTKLKENWYYYTQ